MTLPLLFSRILETASVLLILLVAIQSSLSFVLIAPPFDGAAITRHCSGESADTTASTLRSMTFCNLNSTQQPQLLCDFLMEIGAYSTSIIDADRDTPREQAIYREPTMDDNNTWSKSSDANAAVVCGDAAVGKNVWNRCNVTAHFAASANLQQVAEMVSTTLELPLSYNVETVPNRDWVVHVQQSWKPIRISNLVLRFPWHSDQNVQELVGSDGDDDENVVELQLEGGIAFGTGEHPTTQLCLEWIQDSLQKQDITTILDYGCGSGVLGMAACALSSPRNSVTAVGIDIDVDAVRIANANAKTNGLSMKSYLPSLTEIQDDESKSVLLRAHQVSTDEVLPSNDDTYDACVANILAMPLVTLAPTLASMVKPKGYLGLSGILKPQAEMIIDAYSEYFDNVRVQDEKDGWILVTGIRKERSS